MKVEQLNILAQPIFKFICPRKVLKDTISTLMEEEWQEFPACVFTRDQRLEKREEYKELFDWFHKCLDQVKDELQLSCESLKITQAWASKISKGDNHFRHSHPNSYASGLLYLNDSDAFTFFVNHNKWNDNLKLQPFGGTECVYAHKSAQAELLIFPSSLDHGVNNGHLDPDEDRFTLSFNSFPTGTVGNYEALSAFENYII